MYLKKLLYFFTLYKILYKKYKFNFNMILNMFKIFYPSINNFY